MKKLISAVTACSAVLALIMAATATSEASYTSPALTWARINVMAPGQLAALQNPLITVADRISVAGAMMPGLYSAIALDTPDNAVDVYVTDIGQSGRLLRMAKEGDPRLDLRNVRVLRSRYSLAALTAASDRLTSAHVPFRIYAIVQAGQGQALELQVPDPQTALQLSGKPLAALGGRSVRQLAGVTLTFVRGVQLAGATRENDVPPFIGGDFASGWNTQDRGRPYCTAGIPVENSSGQDGLIEAGHCFTPGSAVYAQDGRYIGRASRIVDQYDAEIIWTGKYHGAGSNADEGEYDTSIGGIHRYPLVGVASPVPGEDLCQDGISSYSLRRGVPCNIRVDGPATYYLCPLANGRCGYVDGYDADSDNGRPIIASGDSGAVVFAIHGPGTRSAVGMIDATTAGCSPNCYHLALVTQAGIMTAFGVHLNPHR